MERRYLVATLAIIATFAVFSHGLRTLEHVSLTYGRQAGADLRAKCNADASAASGWMAKVRSHLRPGNPVEAQLLAEMGLPVALAQAKVADEVARQNTEAARCARETALRQAERARRQAERAQREATRMRDRMTRHTANASAMPMAWEANAEDVNQLVREQTAGIAERIAAQVAAEQMQDASIDVSDFDTASSDSADAEHDSSARAGCTRTQSREQVAQTIRARSRAIVRQVQQSFGYR